MNALTRVKRTWLFSAIFMCFFAVNTHASALWQGEEIISGAGYPAIVKFNKGDADKALLVFIPGAHHSARIAYGGHSGSHEKDFLAYWLGELGYNFLAISYPIELKSQALPSTYPDFSTRDWGQQAAEITQQVIEEHQLSGKVIVLGWSMAGKVAQPYYEAAKAINLDFDFYTSLAATPPTLGAITMNKQVAMAESGLADRSSAVPAWYKQIKSNETNDRTIIPWDIYQSAYTGNISVQQQGYGLRYDAASKQFVRDFWADQQDLKPYDHVNFPLVATLVPNDKMDLRHSVTDPAVWSPYNANKLFKLYSKQKGKDKANEAELNRFAQLVHSAPVRLSSIVSGNHFFFVGESGAKHTAAHIQLLEQKVALFKSELQQEVGITVE